MTVCNQRTGRELIWRFKQKPTKTVIWSKRDIYGRKVKGSLRTIAHLDRTNKLAKKRFGVEIQIIQPCYNTSVAASAGTHDYDACLDVRIPGVSWWTQQKFFRANGWGAYYRSPAQGFSNHIHMFSLPEREGKSVSDDYKVHGFKVGRFVDGGFSTLGRQVASSQIEDYYNHRNALASHAHDSSWFPSNITATIFNLTAYINRRKNKKR